MKTMTCKQLGGPCNVEHHGDDHNEVIKAQDRHLKARVAAGDESHREAHEAMRGRWKHPVSGLGWYRDVKRAFADLPDDAAATTPRAGTTSGLRPPARAAGGRRRRRTCAPCPSGRR